MAPRILMQVRRLGLASRICIANASILVFFACHDPNPAEESLSNDVPAPSRIDYALSFDGLDDYATLGTARFPLPTAPQTISLWIAPHSTGAIVDLVTLRRDDSGNELRLSDSGAPAMWRIWGPSVLVESTGPLEWDTWHHIAYVYDTTTHSIYVDGVLSGTGVASTNNHSPTSGWLGSFDGTRNFFGGLVDDVRIWAQARTEAELNAEFVGNAPASDPDLVGYYSFDEADGLRAYDRSGTGNHMALGDGITARAPIRVISSRP